MQGDKRLGLGLGILLVGVVGAFFFRLEPPANRPAPQLNDPKQLDEQIAQRAVTPYSDSVDRENPRSSETAPGARGPAEDAWALPDFLQDGGGPAAASGAPAPNPIPDPVTTSPPTRSVPEHNRAWRAADEAAALHETSAGPSAAAGSDAVLHRVVQGDTLSGLAARYLGSSSRFLEIYEANRDVLRSPNDLRVGLVLRIPSRREAPPPPADSAHTVRVSESQSRPAGSAFPSVTAPVMPAITERMLPEESAATSSTATEAGDGRTDWRLRFKPFPRSPLPRVPRTGTAGMNPGNPPSAAGSEGSARPAGNTLTPQPPVDLLPLEGVFEDESGR